MNNRSDRFIRRLRKNVGAPDHVTDEELLKAYRGSIVYAFTDLGQAVDDLKSACRSIARKKPNDM